MTTRNTARDRLLAAFPDLLRSQSLASLTLDAICEAGEAHRGSFYHAFSNKQEWAEAGLYFTWSQSRDRLDKVFSSTKTAWERLDAYVDVLTTNQCSSKCVGGCTFFSLGMGLAQSEPTLRSAVLNVLDAYRKYLVDAVREGQAAGTIRQGDPEELARACFHLVEGALSLARIEQQGEPLAALHQSIRWLLEA